MSVGYITAQVFTSRGEIPISDASVSVTSSSGGRKTLQAFRTTDRSGRIQPIAIETPAGSISLAPSSERAFAICDIRVDHPLYETVVIKDVQVFEGITSLQRVQMIPLAENMELAGMTQTFNVLPQNL